MSQPNNSKINSNLVLSISIGFLVVIAAIGVLVWIQQSQNAKPEIASSETTAIIIGSQSSIALSVSSSVSNIATITNSNPALSNQDQTATMVYQDGQYAAVGQYLSPGGRESLEVRISIKNDSIDSYNIAIKEANQTSQLYADFFNEGIDGKINGQKIDSLSSSNINVVNGSSLTSKGFLEALNAIKNKARN